MQTSDNTNKNRKANTIGIENTNINSNINTNLNTATDAAAMPNADMDTMTNSDAGNRVLENIVRILKKNDKITAWTISENINSSSELFFIKEQLDMNRKANTHEFTIQVYTDFVEEDIKYKGNASCTVGISDSEEEIEHKIEDALFSASFVKNKWYDLPVNHGEAPLSIKKFDNLSDLERRFDEIHNILYADYGFTSKVNSCEIFAIEGSRRIITSKGTDILYPYSEFTFEVVTDCNTGSEPVEIFNGYYLTHIDADKIREIIAKQLLETEGRSKAVRNPKLTNQRVILSGDAVEDFLSFYLSQASDYFVYSGISNARLGEHFQKEDAKERLSLVLNPALDCSIKARPVDGEGRILKRYELYQEGKVVNLKTSARFSHYLGIEHLGNCFTFEVKGGDTELQEYMCGDYIEILAFSSFNLDEETGDFGGEFRLAKQVKDGEVAFITGGSISENVMKIQNIMHFSKEISERKCSKAPKAIIMDGITVAGE